MTSSIGSTSCAMTTSCAFFSSHSLVMWLMPYLTYSGFFDVPSSSPASFATAFASIRSFFCCLSSGRYLCSSLKRLSARFLSSVFENWLIAGGTLSRWYRILRARWMRMYLGHRTYRLRSRRGWTSWPIPKFFGFFSHSGPAGSFSSAFFPFGSSVGGGAAAFFPPFFGAITLRARGREGGGELGWAVGAKGEA